MRGLVLTLTFGHVTRGFGMVLYATPAQSSGIKWDSLFGAAKKKNL